jgi:hypothetical protein
LVFPVNGLVVVPTVLISDQLLLTKFGLVGIDINLATL